MVNSLDDLKKHVQQFADLLHLEAKVSGEGAFFSDTAIVVDSPVERDMETGRAMSGGAGAELFKHLRKHELNRNNVYVTCAIKRIIHRAVGKRNAIDANEVSNYKLLLEEELGKLPNLKYILILGNFALGMLTGNRGVNSWRGSVLDIEFAGKKVKAVVALNPYFVLRDPKQEIVFSMDMKKLDLVRKGRWEIKNLTEIINPSFNEVREYITEMENSDRVSYDIETISNETACIGLAASTTEAMCINFRTLHEQTYTVEEERIIRRDLQRLFSNPKPKLIAQNNSFDASWLWFKDRIRVKPIYMDTMLAHHCLYPQLPHNLGFLTTQYTTRPYYKDDKDTWREGGDIDTFWRYNCEDACNTFEAAIKMEDELRNQGMDKFFFEHIMQAQPYLIQMTVGGILLDVEFKEELKETLGREVGEHLKHFHKLVQDFLNEPEYEPNPNSPKQMSKLLFNELRLVGRGSSTDAENRGRMFKHPATSEAKREILRAIDQYAKSHKFYSTYVATEYDDDGRMRSEYSQVGVQNAPGRLSSKGVLWRNSNNEQTGTNLQNQPADAYDMYIADEGYGFVYFDLAQVEARYVACFANIGLWLEQFEQARVDKSFDAHCALASVMFNIPYDEVPKQDRIDGETTVRFIAKRCRHGLNYRMMPDRLAATTGMSMSEAQANYRLYHQTNPELQRWWHELEEEVRKTRKLYNGFGRRLYILERITPEAMESIVAFKPQSTAGDKVVRVIYQCMSDPRWPRTARIVLNIHDALVALCRLEDRELCASIMKLYAEEPIILNGHKMIVPTDFAMSVPNERGKHSWGSLEEVEVEAAKAIVQCTI